jgi:hypothetical protein
MFLSLVELYYYGLKTFFLYSLVRTQAKYEPMRDSWLFLGVLYTVGVAFLSYVFLESWKAIPWQGWQVRVAAKLGISPWQAWLGETFLLSAFYFKLLSRFDEGILFWVLLVLGFGLVYF